MRKSEVPHFLLLKIKVTLLFLKLDEKKSVTLHGTDAFSLWLNQVDWILDKIFERLFAVSVKAG